MPEFVMLKKCSTSEVMLEGTSPLVIHRYGVLPGAPKSPYAATEGWDGIPAAYFKSALISAAQGIDPSLARRKRVSQAIYIRPDGFDCTDGTPLVRIYGKCRMWITQLLKN